MRLSVPIGPAHYGMGIEEQTEKEEKARREEERAKEEGKGRERRKRKEMRGRNGLKDAKIYFITVFSEEVSSLLARFKVIFSLRV